MNFSKKFQNLFSPLIKMDYPLSSLTTLGVGGNAKYLLLADSLYTVKTAIELAKECAVPYKIIGNGSNLLVSDSGYDGLIISAKDIKDIFLLQGGFVKAMSGASLNSLINFCVDKGLTGIESLSGIPATVGGIVAMNGSAFNTQISSYIKEVECISNGKLKKYYNHECKFQYRNSIFLQKKEFISSVIFQFEKGDKRLSKSSVSNYLAIRNKIQPQGRSCGSVFKNTKTYSAGYLIEKAGLKGIKIGGAKVSEKHANFIINFNKATATDVYLLINKIKQSVYQKYKIRLKEEVEYVGEFNDINGRLSHSHKI